MGGGGREGYKPQVCRCLMQLTTFTLFTRPTLLWGLPGLILIPLRFYYTYAALTVCSSCSNDRSSYFTVLILPFFETFASVTF